MSEVTDFLTLHDGKQATAKYRGAFPFGCAQGQGQDDGLWRDSAAEFRQEVGGVDGLGEDLELVALEAGLLQ